MAAAPRFAVCIRNEEHEESLDLRKVYEVLDDPVAEERGFIRVIDEDGEDYLCPKSWFLPLEVPKKTEEALRELVQS